MRKATTIVSITLFFFLAASFQAYAFTFNYNTDSYDITIIKGKYDSNGFESLFKEQEWFSNPEIEEKKDMAEALALFMANESIWSTANSGGGAVVTPYVIYTDKKRSHMMPFTASYGFNSGGANNVSSYDVQEYNTKVHEWAVVKSPVPEPATMLLFGLGLLGLVGVNRRKQ